MNTTITIIIFVLRISTPPYYYRDSNATNITFADLIIGLLRHHRSKSVVTATTNYRSTTTTTTTVCSTIITGRRAHFRPNSGVSVGFMAWGVKPKIEIFCPLAKRYRHALSPNPIDIISLQSAVCGR